MSAETIQYRLSQAQEIGAIALVVARANARRDGMSLPDTVEGEQLCDLEERMNRPDAWTLVAVTDEEVVGLALGYPRAEDATPTPSTEYVSLLMVEPDFWGKGIASRLLDLVVERARDAGRSHVTLRTREADNGHARSVYEHKGFALTGATKESPYGRQVEYRLDLVN